LEPLGVRTMLKTDNDVVCLCRLPDYAESLVKVLARAVHLAGGSA